MGMNLIIGDLISRGVLGNIMKKEANIIYIHFPKSNRI